MSSKKEMWFLLDVIDQLTWHKYTDEGKEKVLSSHLEEATGFDNVKIRLLLFALKERKLISNSNKFTGYKSGWFSTAKGNSVANYNRGDNK